VISKSVVMKLQLVSVFLFLSCCEKFCNKSHESMTPEEVVEAYLDIALNMESVDERDDLLQYTTGSIREDLEKATDEVIRKAYVDKKFKLERYSVVERRDRTPRETEITFELSYKDLGDNPKNSASDAVTVSTENTVAVVRVKSQWLIKEVLNKKSTFDFPVTPDTEIKSDGRSTDTE
jgi:hypothetical protein